MNLIDENEERELNQNKKKMFTFIIAAIAILIIIAIGIIVYSNVKKNNTLKFQINETNIPITSGLFEMEDKKNIHIDENNQIYISVKKLSALLGVEFFNDEYKNKGEDTTKCYIKTSNEYTSYISNSSQIYKAVIVEEQQTSTTNSSSKNQESTKKTTEYEYFEVQSPVKYINGEIYASQQAIELGFNVTLYYDQSTKTVSIYTLDALESIAAYNVENAVIGANCSYSNKKLLKYGYVLVQNIDGSYGVANYYNYNPSDYVVSCKYSNIRFIESSSTLIITTAEDNKQGVLKLDLNNQGKANVIIQPNYQSITKLDEDSDLYLVKENGKYGIIKLIGDEINIILKTEYQQIGINDYLYEGMDNKYIINGKYIPVKMDNLWGIVSTEGRILIIPQYSGIGCNLAASGTGTGDGVIIIPELVDGNDGIVFLTDAQNNLYSIINVRNGSQIGFTANEIYSKYEDNVRNYYMKVSVTEGTSTKNIDIYKLFGKKVENVDTLKIDTNANTIENTTTEEATIPVKNAN
ncbi:MAG: WG repeat-containing protein [Clostridia bacterium]|nr:WG repeat-containing protein [Clostridia bacterium]